jgi:hypothetical protein
MGIILDAKPTSAEDRTVFACSPPPKSHYRSFSIWAGSVILLIILILFIFVPPFERQVLNLDALKLPPTAASLIQFHHALSALDRQLTVATTEYENARSMASRGNNLLALFDATNRYEAQLDELYKMSGAIGQPHPHNTESTKWAKKAIEILKSRLILLRTANHIMVDDVDSGQIKQSAFTTWEKARSAADAKFNEEHSALRRSYEALGIPGGRVPSAFD